VFVFIKAYFYLLNSIVLVQGTTLTTASPRCLTERLPMVGAFCQADHSTSLSLNPLKLGIFLSDIGRCELQDLQTVVIER
jgi:hypothetical protein